MSMGQKKQFGDYYIGLDIGTDSIGWAASDVNYELLKLNQQHMWGSFPAFTLVDTCSYRFAFQA